jgi:hypothetical protein
MPTASANIRAKFIAQIVIPVNRLPIHSAPAAATSPEIERSSGMPAAMSEPNDQQHRQRERPRSDLGAKHRRPVLVVELRPERGRAGQRQLNAARRRGLKALLHPARGPHHLRGVSAGAAAHKGDVPVGRDRLTTARKAHSDNRRVTPERLRGCVDGLSERGVAGGVPCRADDDGKRVASLSAEMPLDQSACRN